MIAATTPAALMWAEGAAACLAIIAFLGAVFRLAVRAVVREENKDQADSIRKEMVAEIAPLKAELSPNSGTSIKDVVTKTGLGLTSLTTEFATFRDSTNNHFENLDSKVKDLDSRVQELANQPAPTVHVAVHEPQPS